GMLALQFAELAHRACARANRFRGRRRRVLVGPETEADHLLEDDLVLRRLADTVIEFLAHHRAGRNGLGHAASPPVRKVAATPGRGIGKGAGRIAFVSSKNWIDPLDAGASTHPQLGSRNPFCDCGWVDCPGPVKIGPVTHAWSWCKDGDTPPGLQGPDRPAPFRIR